MADITQQTPASEHDGFIYGLESFVFDGKELGLISNDGLDWGGDEPSTNKIWAAQKRSAPVKEIEEKKVLSDELKQSILDGVKEFKQNTMASF